MLQFTKLTLHYYLYYCKLSNKLLTLNSELLINYQVFRMYLLLSSPSSAMGEAFVTPLEPDDDATGSKIIEKWLSFRNSNALYVILTTFSSVLQKHPANHSILRSLDKIEIGLSEFSENCLCIM